MHAIKLAGSFLLATSLSCSSLALAATVPVIDGYQRDGASANTAAPVAVAAAASPPAAPVNLSVDQRVTVLERQIANFKQLLSQVSDLQQQVQDLRGQLDTQQHDLKTLQSQLRTQYQDLDQRLSAQARKPAARNAAPVAADDLKPVAGSDDSIALPVVKTDGDQAAYQAAFNLLKKKSYPQATTAFKKFIQQHPTSQNIVSANYWLGQLYLLQGQPDKAVTQFSAILKKYPQNSKVPDTMLQLGLAYYAQGDLNQATAQFSRVQKKYPGTSAAKSAQSRLQQIQQAAQGATASDADAGVGSASAD